MNHPSTLQLFSTGRRKQVGRRMNELVRAIVACCSCCASFLMILLFALSVVLYKRQNVVHPLDLISERNQLTRLMGDHGHWSGVT